MAPDGSSLSLINRIVSCGCNTCARLQVPSCTTWLRVLAWWLKRKRRQLVTLTKLQPEEVIVFGGLP